jgi:ketosteroid isomerase-like protein
MSQENVEAARQFMEAVNAGDIETAVRLVHPEVVFIPLRAATEGAFVGRDGLRRFLADTMETFGLFQVGYTDVRDLGDHVLAIGSIRVRGAASGVETDIPSAALGEYRDGLLWRYKDYGDRRAALEAAGLSE